jgi:hypothetical protein
MARSGSSSSAGKRSFSRRLATNSLLILGGLAVLTSAQKTAAPTTKAPKPVAKTAAPTTPVPTPSPTEVSVVQLDPAHNQLKTELVDFVPSSHSVLAWAHTACVFALLSAGSHFSPHRFSFSYIRHPRHREGPTQLRRQGCDRPYAELQTATPTSWCQAWQLSAVQVHPKECRD